MAYSFKLVHGSTTRSLSEHEAKYRVEKQGVAITGMPAGDRCSHCAEGELHVHAADADAPVPPPLPPVDDVDAGKEAQLQDTAPPAAEQVAPAEMTGEQQPDAQAGASAAIADPTSSPAESGQVDAAAEMQAPAPGPTAETPAPAPTSSSSSSGRQGRRGR